MGKLNFLSAGVSATEIDLTGATLTQEPVGIPAGVVGTAVSGPAFVPVTVGNFSDWVAKFGDTDGKKFGPLAVRQWLEGAGGGASAVTYLRVLGVGDGRKRNTTTGEVTSAGFVVGEQQPGGLYGFLSTSSYAVNGGPLGRTYFLGCFMSESAGSTLFSDAGLQGVGSVAGVTSSLPIVRGVLMAPSGVIVTLSSSFVASNSPSSTVAATEAGVAGATLGSLKLTDGGSPSQQFVLFLNGHKGGDNPNVITASFDVTSPDYIGKKLNTDPVKIQEKGHYLYSHWEIHPTLAVVTGTGLVAPSGRWTSSGNTLETAAFVVTSSLGRNVGSATIPNYENFSDRFGHAVSPWVISQKFGGSPQNLFKFHALDDGANNSNQYKITIENITPSADPMYKFGKFDVVLRQWTDRDDARVAITRERFSGVSLDPSADSYIAKKIGDVYAYFDFDREESEQKIVVEGNYANRSNYIRVEMNTDVENGFVDPSALPLGFRGVDHLLTSGSAPLAALNSSVASTLYGGGTNFLKRSVTPPLPLRRKITTGTEWTASESVNPDYCWGVQFEHPQSLVRKNENPEVNNSLQAFVKFYPKFAVSNANFAVGDNTGAADSAAWGVVDADRFCNNLFTLENVQVVTASNGLADPDPKKWRKAVYVRNGNVGSYESTNIAAMDSLTADDINKLRAFKTDDLSVSSNRTYAKFNMVMQGGFDGVNIFDKDESELNNTAVTADMEASGGRGRNEGPNVRTYIKALDLMKNTVNMDIQLLAIPGIRHEIVTDAAILAVEERFDALYIMDLQQTNQSGDVEYDPTKASVSNTLQTFKNRGVDSSFAAAYFPDVRYRDPNGTNLYVPPSVVVLGAMAVNDRVGHPWFAPAGFARGTLSNSDEVAIALKQEEMDSLYNSSINPIKKSKTAVQSGTNPTPGGLVVWGQKTLQVAASALDRINVRRLLIEIRRQVRDISQGILFEPNREATLGRFSAAITPRLQAIQSLSGLERFKVVIDSSTTTQEDIENNTIRGKIFVQPTKTIEFVSLDFVVTNNLNQVQ